MARGRPRRRTPTPLARDNAFINVPYDRRYEGIYLAFIAGLSAFGLIPRATLEIPGSDRRLDRIVHLLRRCRYSFHDLSRVEIDRTPPPTPRFNMPFELGLAVALKKAGYRHQWFVFEERPHRITKSLSDLNGTDAYIHDGRPDGVLSALANALVRIRHRPTLAQMWMIYADLQTGAHAIKRDLRTTTLFGARAFRDLGVAARISSENRIPSLTRRRRV